MRNLLADLRYTLRSLGRSPGFVAVAVACLAIGIGANATMFGIVDTLLFRPPAHVVDAEDVRRLYLRRTFPGIGERGLFATVCSKTPGSLFGRNEAPGMSSPHSARFVP